MADKYLTKFSESYGDYIADADADVMSTHGSSREFLDVDTNISVRSDFARADFDYYRQYSQIPNTPEKIIEWCMRVYDKVGIIRNVIDLMSDFACQGVRLQHPNPSIQRFYSKWFQKVNGVERSERFLNLLYRCGNVVVKRRNGKIPSGTQEAWKRVHGTDIKFAEDKANKLEIPLDYKFLHPNTIDIVGGQMSTFTGKPIYALKISDQLRSELNKISSSTKADVKALLSELPDDIKKALKLGINVIPLDQAKIHVFHYKKDDWQVWANPMTYPLLDDLVTYEKMRLADLAALDGAISNVRLWTYGVLDPSNPANSILPTRAGINKLRNILHHSVGGGTIDLVWGPELKFQESSSQVYRFLGADKYEVTLNSIYDGMGIPSVLRSGSNRRSTGTSSYISLKTLVERLEYGRNILVSFWNEQVKLVQLAMGFDSPAKLTFDKLVLADESTILQLLVQLADRDYISMETLHENFDMIPDIERLRISKDSKKRGKSLPEKAGPYHDAMWRKTMEKEQLRLQMKNDPLDGRPPGVIETNKRKPKPQSVIQTNADMMRAIMWAEEAYNEIAHILSPVVLKTYGKSNFRQLTDKESKEYEYLKFSILAGLQVYGSVTNDIVASLIGQDNVTQEMKDYVTAACQNIMVRIGREPNVDELRKIRLFAYLSQGVEDDGESSS